MKKTKRNRKADRKVNRNYKDTVFRKIFRDKRALLSLYNAVNGTSYEDEEELEIYQLENAIYMKIKNDVSFLFDLSLNLYEHQSTYNPNLPLRDLFYIADLLKRYTKEMNLYSSAQIKIPTPRFVIFYNGVDWNEERKELRLSDAFFRPTNEPELELRATMYNLNYGQNPQIQEHCKRLKDYMIFVERVRIYVQNMEIEEAVNRAVEECIKEGVLADFLLENKAEAIAMSIYEYDEEKHMKAERKEHYELGYRDGKKEGVREGERRGIAILIELYQETGMDREKAKGTLLNKLDLTEREIEEYLRQYWKEIK